MEIHFLFFHKGSNAVMKARTVPKLDHAAFIHCGRALFYTGESLCSPLEGAVGDDISPLAPSHEIMDGSVREIHEVSDVLVSAFGESDDSLS